MYGGNGDDILYGSVMADRIYGDWLREKEDAGKINSGGVKFDLEGGDDIIYTGVNEGKYGDRVHGGFGDDKIYGQGETTATGHRLYGEFGDDEIWGSDGKDFIWGDDGAYPNFVGASEDPEDLRWSS